MTIAARQRQAVGAVMWTMTLLFALRVTGQMLVEFRDVSWLPAVQHWDSGLLPYSALLAFQVVILLVFASVDRQVRRDQGWLTAPRPRLARWLR